MICITVHPKGKREPRWKRQVFLDETTGEIYVPAAAFSDGEAVAYMSACYEGLGVVQDSGHPYLPLSFARKEDPDGKELWDLITGNVACAMKEKPCDNAAYSRAISAHDDPGHRREIVRELLQIGRSATDLDHAEIRRFYSQRAARRHP